MREMKPVPLKLFVTGQRALDAERGESGDSVITILRALPEGVDTWEAVSVAMRLRALTYAFKDQPSNEFVIKAHGRNYDVVHTIMYVVAAKAPLHYNTDDDEFYFKPDELLALAREEFAAYPEPTEEMAEALD